MAFHRPSIISSLDPDQDPGEGIPTVASGVAEGPPRFPWIPPPFDLSFELSVPIQLCRANNIQSKQEYEMRILYIFSPPGM